MRTIGFIAALVMVIGVVALLAFCSQPQSGGASGGLFGGGANREEITKARASVQSRMANPQSAAFSDVGVYEFQGQKLVCGYVDGADASGKMVGRQRFLAGRAGTMLESELEDTPQAFEEAWAMGCQNLVLRDN